ncbi:hypothetical protein Aperf_G00000038490 [Anoplocephala perfoliata]
MGFGALCLSANLIVMHYFERFRGAASGIAAAGSGLGYIIAPLLLSSLSRYFKTDVGWRSVVLVYSIILILVTLLCDLTFRPLKIETLRDVETNEIEQMAPASKTNLGPEKDKEAISDDDSKAVPKKIEEWLVRFFDLTLFLDAGFFIMCASAMAFQMSYFIPFTYFLLFATNQAGLLENDALSLLTFTGILHTIGRFVGGMLANIPGVDIVIVAAISCILCGTCHFALPFLPHTFVALAVYCSGFGLLCAKIYDSTSSLDGTFYWCGACFVLSGLVLFFLYLPCVKESAKE